MFNQMYERFMRVSEYVPMEKDSNNDLSHIQIINFVNNLLEYYNQFVDVPNSFTCKW